MSVTCLICLNDKFISIVGDRRLSKGDGTYNENFQKVRKINNKIVMASTGNIAFMEVIMKNLKNRLFNLSNAENFFNSVSSVLIRIESDKSVFLVVGGLGKDNEIYCGIYNTSERKKMIVTYTQGRIASLVLEPPGVDGKN